MRNHDYHISAFRAHLRYVLTRGFSDVVDFHLAAEVGFIPCHDLRRHKTDIADAQGYGVDHHYPEPRYPESGRGVNIGFAGFEIDNVGVNVGEFRPGQRLVQEVETVVEFMVSQIADGVIQGVHRLIKPDAHPPL